MKKTALLLSVYLFAIQSKQCNAMSFSEISNRTDSFDVDQLPKTLPPLDTAQTKVPPSQQLTSSPYSNYRTESPYAYNLNLPATTPVNKYPQKHLSTSQANENEQIPHFSPDKISSSQHTSQIPGYSMLIKSLLKPHDSNIDPIRQQSSQEKENNPPWEFEDWQPIRRLKPRRKRSAKPYRTQCPKPKDKDLEESNNCPCPMSMCPESFGSFKLLFNHLRMHDINDHYCYYCQQRLSSKDTFCNHILNMHTEISLLKCKKCLIRFKTVAGYRKHTCTNLSLQNISVYHAAIKM